MLIAVPTLLGGEVTGMVYCGHRKAYAEAAPQTGDLVRRVRQLSVDLGRLGLRRPRPVTPVVEPLADLDSSSREARAARSPSRGRSAPTSPTTPPANGLPRSRPDSPTSSPATTRNRLPNRRHR